MIIYSEWHTEMSKIDELRSYAKELDLNFDVKEHDESDELFKVIISTSKQNLKDFHDHCYTQTCTMKHMDNTDWERGYMDGIRFGRRTANRFFADEEE